MADFLAKSKVGSSVLPTKQREVAESTDFDKVFKPFALRRGIDVAPMSYFGASRGRLKGVEDNPIAALDGGVSPLPPPPALVIQPPPINLPGAFISPFRAAYPLNPRCKTAFAR
jgi:hypothetical protein